MKRPRVEFYLDAVGEWRWRVIAANGRIVATGEGHRDRAAARRAFTTAQQTARDAWVGLMAEESIARGDG